MKKLSLLSKQLGPQVANLMVLSPVEDIKVLSLYQYFFANNIDNQVKCFSLLRGQLELELQCLL